MQPVPAGRRIRLITCVSSGIPAGTPRLTPAREPAGSPQRDGPTLSERPGRGTEGERGSPAPHSKLEAALLAAASRTLFRDARARADEVATGTHVPAGCAARGSRALRARCAKRGIPALQPPRDSNAGDTRSSCALYVRLCVVLHTPPVGDDGHAENGIISNHRRVRAEPAATPAGLHCVATRRVRHLRHAERVSAVLLHSLLSTAELSAARRRTSKEVLAACH